MCNRWTLYKEAPAVVAADKLASCVLAERHQLLGSWKERVLLVALHAAEGAEPDLGRPSPGTEGDAVLLLIGFYKCIHLCHGRSRGFTEVVERVESS